jgi:Tfp pilus assembly protein FimT
MNPKLSFHRPATRRVGLTLLELVVVVVILAILASLVIPRLGGLTSQASTATAADLIADVSRAVSLFETRNSGKAPNGWDGILNGPTGSLYSKLHPNLTNTTNVALPKLSTLSLSAIQAQSLADAGITFLHYNSESTATYTGLPSDSGVSWAQLATGTNVAQLLVQGTADGWTTHGSTFADRAFNLNPFNYGPQSPLNGQRSFVVFGVGQPCSIRGNTLQEAPIVQAADPARYYARMLCVYMIPGPNSTTSFPAQFVGVFSPDGTSVNDNVNKFTAATAVTSSN